MSGQNTLLVIAEDAQVNRPSHKWNWQVYRDTAIAGSGTYKAMDENGVVEILGGPGAGFGVNIEQGLFTLNAAGTVATGGVLTNPGANPIITIPTARRLKMAHIRAAWLNGINALESIGQGNDILNFCINPNNAVQTQNPSNCINIQDGANGWFGLITSINNNSYSITFTKVGAGLDLENQWQGIM